MKLLSGSAGNPPACSSRSQPGEWVAFRPRLQLPVSLSLRRPRFRGGAFAHLEVVHKLNRPVDCVESSISGRLLGSVKLGLDEGMSGEVSSCVRLM